MSRKQPVPPGKGLALGRPEDREPEGETSLKRVAGSSSRAFNTVLINATLAALWCPASLPEQAQEDRRLAAIQGLMALQPQDAIEGLIAAQAVAMHHASMECFRGAMLPDQPVEVATRLRKDGANLARGMVEMVEALARKRGKAPQVVRVERVVVQEGGQAIVGAVAPVLAPKDGRGETG
jgi:hypothetical protein